MHNISEIQLKLSLEQLRCTNKFIGFLIQSKWIDGSIWENSKDTFFRNNNLSGRLICDIYCKYIDMLVGSKPYLLVYWHRLNF